jgi:cytochrome c oxidase subunit 2
MPLFRKTKRWVILLTAMLLSSLLLAACGEGSPSILDTHGPIAGNEAFVFYVILGIATVIFLGVESMLLYSIIRFRERPGMPRPRQIHGSLRIEVIWTVLPSIVLFVVLFFTIQGLFAVAAQPTGDALVVEAVGHQWWWEFYYPQYNITTADTLEAPVAKIVHVNLFSNNVIHSFWVPQLTGKTDVIPGHNNQKWFKADNTGEYLGICTEYCGTQHANMRFNVRVVNPDEFQTWVTTQQQAAVTATGSLEQQGAKLFAQGSCAGCHGIVGVNVKGYYDPAKACANFNSASTDAEQCKVGPNLTHFGSRDMIAGGVLTNNKDQCQPGHLQNCNLAKWLADPPGVKPGSDMPALNLTPDQINALVAYLESLK